MWRLRNFVASRGACVTVGWLALVGPCLVLSAPARAQVQSERLAAPESLRTASRKKILAPPVTALSVEQRLKAAAAERMLSQGHLDSALPFPRTLQLAAPASISRSQRVVPPGDTPGSQGPTLVAVGTSSGLPEDVVKQAAARLGSLQKAACAVEIVDGLDAAQKSVRALPVDDLDVPADDRLYRWLLHRPGAERETDSSIAALKNLEGAWKTMLTKCFAAPRNDPMFSKIAGRVGAFSAGGSAPFCSGTLVEDGKILTARHCFFDFVQGSLIEPHTAKLTFAVADGSAVLPIAASALRAISANPFDAANDWLIVDAPKLGKPIPKLGLATNFTDFVEAARANVTPTQLELFSVVPLASTLDPADFPESIVAFPVSGCYAVVVQPQCITHMCGVVPGGSGASIFSRSTGDPLWAGLHIGPETVENGSCSATPEPVASNLGIRGVSGIDSYFQH
jgi:hypothetical protein